MDEVACPGCGLSMPRRDDAPPDGYFNTSRECWAVYTEVLAAEYSDAVLFGQVHQLTVDTYAMQHAGGPHPDKSVCIHLCGLHLVLDRGMRPTAMPPILQAIVARMKTWPHFDPPDMRLARTAFDVAVAKSFEEHVAVVRDWAGQVWHAWREHHAEVARLVGALT